MRVKELINKLSEYDSDMEVLIEVDKTDVYLEGQDISRVEDMTDYVFLIVRERDDEN